MCKHTKTLATALATVLLFGGCFTAKECFNRERRSLELPIVAFSETSTPDYDKQKYWLITLYYGDEVAYAYARKGVSNNFSLLSIADYFPNWNKDKNETFLGWYAGADGSGKKYMENTTQTLRSDLTLYAKIEKTETVSVVCYDGEDVLLEKSFIKGEGYTLSEFNLDPPVKYGYTFDGWKDENGEPVLEETEFSADENRSFYTSYTVGKAYGASISLSGDVGLNLYLEFAPEIYQSESELKIVFDGKEESRKIASGTPVTIGGVRYYKYSFSTNPKDFDKVLEISVVTDTGRGSVFSYSVKEYIETLLLAEGYEKEKPLATALKNYCEAAKGYFYNLSVADIPSVDIETLEDYGRTATGWQEGVTVLGATLSLETKTAIRIYFTAEESPNCKIDGSRVTPQYFYDGEQKIFYLEIPDLYAQDLDKAYLIEIGGIEIYYSGYAYAYEVLLTSNDATLRTLAKALYLYGEAAKDYFQ